MHKVDYLDQFNHQERPCNDVIQGEFNHLATEEKLFNITSVIHEHCMIRRESSCLPKNTKNLQYIKITIKKWIMI